MSKKTIKQVLEENTSKWLDIPGIVGTAIGMCKDKPCIKIFTSIPTDEIQSLIPDTIEGYQLDIEYAGQIRALDQ